MAFEAYESITVDVSDGVATITSHRPEKYDALSTEVYFDLARAFAEIQLDRSIDVTVEDIVGAIQNTGKKAVKNSKRAINDSANAPDLETAHDYESEVRWEQFATQERVDFVDEFDEE